MSRLIFSLGGSVCYGSFFPCFLLILSLPFMHTGLCIHGGRLAPKELWSDSWSLCWNSSDWGKSRDIIICNMDSLTCWHIHWVEMFNSFRVVLDNYSFICHDLMSKKTPAMFPSYCHVKITIILHILHNCLLCMRARRDYDHILFCLLQLLGMILSMCLCKSVQQEDYTKVPKYWELSPFYSDSYIWENTSVTITPHQKSNWNKPENISPQDKLNLFTYVCVYEIQRHTMYKLELFK